MWRYIAKVFVLTALLVNHDLVVVQASDSAKAECVICEQKAQDVKKELSDSKISSTKSINDIYCNNATAIVLVRCKHGNNDTYIGSGFFISDKGHIITANVTNEEQDYYIEFNAAVYKASYIGHDPVSCVSLLKVESLPNGATFLSIPELEPLPTITSELVSLSFKLGLNVSPQTGIVTGHNGSTQFYGQEWPTTMLRTTLHIDGGDCGGAVFDTNGKLEGMLLFALADTSETYTIPSVALHKICNELLLFGRVRYAYLGIVTESVIDTEVNELRLKIVEINKNSPAEQAGLKQNDIILSIDDKKILSREDLRLFSFFSTPNQVLNVDIIRDNKNMSINVTTTEKQS